LASGRRRSSVSLREIVGLREANVGRVHFQIGEAMNVCGRPVNAVGSFRTDYKNKKIYNDIYFVRGKGGGRESLSSIKERMSRGRLKVRRGTIPSWQWKFMSSALL